MNRKMIVKYRPLQQKKDVEEKEIEVVVSYDVSEHVEGHVYKCKVERHEEDLPLWLKPTYFELEAVYPHKGNNFTYQVSYPQMDNLDAKLFTYKVYSVIYATESYEAVRS